ncbi:MAG: 50S ribosomal protein L30 [Spirochaetia bacterium]
MAKDSGTKNGKKVKVTLVRSPIGKKPKHRKTLEALGLKKMNHSVIKELNPAVQGMINTVSFMVETEEID